MPIGPSGTSGGTAGTLIARAQATTGNNATTTSASLADVDASNAVVTFTTPASGAVLVVASFFCNISNAAQNGQIGLREATSNVFGPFTVASGNVTLAIPNTVISPPMLVSGLTAGASHTYKLAFAATGGATFTIQNVGSAATNYPITMMVYAA